MFSWRQISRCIAALVLVCPVISAQVIRVNAGSSDQYNSSGGSLEFGTAHLTSGLGIGTVNGKLRTGAYLRETIGNYNFILGDQSTQLELPTDLFGGSQQAEIRGISVGRSNDVNQAFVFAGYKSLSYGAPFFRAAATNDPVGIILFSHRFNDRVKFVSRNLLSSEKTSIQGLEWLAKDWLKLSASGGVGSGKPYGAIAGTADFHQFVVKAAYIAQGTNFRRAAFDSVVISEPVGTNIAVNWRPTRRLSTDYSHMKLNGADLQQGTLPAASLDSAGINWNSRAIRAGANFFTSTALNNRTNAFSLNGGRKITKWVDLNVSWLQNKSHTDKKWSSSLLSTFRENVSPRLELLQLLTRSNGNTTASFGGNWIGNRLSFGLEYQTIYVPYMPSKPFMQAAVLNIRLRPFGNLQLHAGTAVGADGKVRYTAWAEDLIVRNAGLSSSPQGTMISMPKYIVRGQVTDDKSNPLRGVALRIGKELVYTDEDGMFFVRMNKRGEVPLSLLFDEFIVSGYWEKVVAPDRVLSDLDEKAPHLEIVIRRISKDESHRRQLQPQDAKEKPGSPVARVDHPVR
jgi:hypothetical protein